MQLLLFMLIVITGKVNGLHYGPFKGNVRFFYVLEKYCESLFKRYIFLILNIYEKHAHMHETSQLS
jgi:hypothetical protein